MPDQPLIERVARELALNYYQGCFRERFSRQDALTNATGCMKVGTTLASDYIEEQARDMAERFWPCWEKETKALLTEPL